jgi:hypothetical protein
MCHPGSCKKITVAVVRGKTQMGLSENQYQYHKISFLIIIAIEKNIENKHSHSWTSLNDYYLAVWRLFGSPEMQVEGVQGDSSPYPPAMSQNPGILLFTPKQ